jgi:ABC-type branched-subunit amino acid transport system permease subunit
MTAIATAVPALAVHLPSTAAGMPTLGTAACSAGGAFSAAHLSGAYVMLPLPLLAGLLIAAVTGLLVVCSTGLTTVMITLPAAEIIHTDAGHWRPIIGGSTSALRRLADQTLTATGGAILTIVDSEASP